MNDNTDKFFKNGIEDVCLRTLLFELNDKITRKKFKRNIKKFFSTFGFTRIKELYTFCDENFNTQKVIEKYNFEFMIFVRLKSESDYRLYHCTFTKEGVIF